MPTHQEMRAEARQLVFHGGWFWRLLGVVLVLGTVAVLMALLVKAGFSRYGIVTLSEFAKSMAQMQQSTGLAFVPPSQAALGRMVTASVFQQFLAYVFNGIFTFGFIAVCLRAVRSRDEGWFDAAFGGFRCPLGCAWLLFRMQLQITLWTMLFLVPGLVAFYRYRQAWNLKADHPDWSAGRCLKESGRMMDGHKLELFGFDCSFWLAITLVLLPLLALTALAPLGLAGLLPRDQALTLATVLALVTLVAAVIFGVYYAVALAIYYRELSERQPAVAGA